MKFSIMNNRDFNQTVVIDPDVEITLDSVEVLGTGKNTITCAVYHMETCSVGNIFCNVLGELTDEEYILNFYAFSRLSGDALETFKEYLKENHKKNIIDLTL